MLVLDIGHGLLVNHGVYYCQNIICLLWRNWVTSIVLQVQKMAFITFKISVPNPIIHAGMLDTHNLVTCSPSLNIEYKNTPYKIASYNNWPF